MLLRLLLNVDLLWERSIPSENKMISVVWFSYLLGPRQLMAMNGVPYFAWTGCDPNPPAGFCGTQLKQGLKDDFPNGHGPSWPFFLVSILSFGAVTFHVSIMFWFIWQMYDENSNMMKSMGSHWNIPMNNGAFNGTLLCPKSHGTWRHLATEIQGPRPGSRAMSKSSRNFKQQLQQMQIDWFLERHNFHDVITAAGIWQNIGVVEKASWQPTTQCFSEIEIGKW